MCESNVRMENHAGRTVVGCNMAFTIDNGAELFGDHTPLLGGGYAADGFAALVQEDTNTDGKVDALDARFADLRVWRDTNQNGISEASELSTLTDANIAAINVAKTANSQTLANGNQIADLGTYIKTDGSVVVAALAALQPRPTPCECSIGGLGETHGLADMSGRVAAQQRGTHRPTPCGYNLAADTFHRQFTTAIPPTPETAALPDMRGTVEFTNSGIDKADILLGGRAANTLHRNDALATPAKRQECTLPKFNILMKAA